MQFTRTELSSVVDSLCRAPSELCVLHWWAPLGGGGELRRFCQRSTQLPDVDTRDGGGHGRQDGGALWNLARLPCELPWVASLDPWDAGMYRPTPGHARCRGGPPPDPPCWIPRLPAIGKMGEAGRLVLVVGREAGRRPGGGTWGGSRGDSRWRRPLRKEAGPGLRCWGGRSGGRQ
jgi:hypothetical protein